MKNIYFSDHDAVKMQIVPNGNNMERDINIDFNSESNFKVSDNFSGTNFI